MMSRPLLLVLLTSSCLGLTGAQEDATFELNTSILELSVESAVLSALAYANSSDYVDSSSPTGFAHPSYEAISFFTEEPDQAIVAQTADKCYLAFRGTNANAADWQQNIDLASRDIYLNNDTSVTPACEARAGFADFLDTSVVQDGLATLVSCLTAVCPTFTTDPCNCLVLTGHSQGGATATVASILLNQYCPLVITFGQPPALDPGCPHVPSHNVIRYVNAKQESDGDLDMGFDPVPYSPTFLSGSSHYGHFVHLADDETAVKYLGMDEDSDFSPALTDLAEIAAHSMGCENGTLPFTYECRVAALLASAQASESGSVPTTGFANGVFCEPGYSELCNTGRCSSDTFMCEDTIPETCIKASCELDSDCASGVCIWDACATAQGEVEQGCPCGTDVNCKNNDCDITSLFNLDWQCAVSKGRSVFWERSNMMTGAAVVSLVMLLW